MHNRKYRGSLLINYFRKDKAGNHMVEINKYRLKKLQLLIYLFYFLKYIE